MDKYSWVDIGSSYLPGEIVAAFLWAQMEEAQPITDRRLTLWARYHHDLEPLERDGAVARPRVPAECLHNAHMYYLLLPGLAARTAFIERLRAVGIHCVFHYVPLHSSVAGKQFGRAHGSLDVTDDVAARLVRLPLWVGLEDQQARIIDAVASASGAPGA